MNARIIDSLRKHSKLAGVPAWLLIGVLLWANGCNWFKNRDISRDSASTDPVTFRLSPFRLSENSIALEIGIMEIGDQQAGQVEQLWAHLDNQMIALEPRQIWDQNGLQSAVVASQPPAVFWQLLDPKVEYLDDDDKYYQQKLRQTQGLPEQKNVVVLQKANLVAGKPHYLPTGPIVTRLHWQLMEGDQRQNGSCELAQCYFRIIAYHDGESKVRIRLTPEIRYGEKKKRIAVNADSFYWEPAQESLTFHEAAIEVPVQKGQTVLCGSTSLPGPSLGSIFFRTADSQRVLFVRVIGIGGDHLFSPGQKSEPLATPLD